MNPPQGILARDALTGLGIGVSGEGPPSEGPPHSP